MVDCEREIFEKLKAKREKFGFNKWYKIENEWRMEQMKNGTKIYFNTISFKKY
jgi:hypothetical protein